MTHRPRRIRPIGRMATPLAFSALAACQLTPPPAAPGARPRAASRILARGTSVFRNRWRPLCAYPQHAPYNSSGDAEKAENFTCTIVP